MSYTIRYKGNDVTDSLLVSGVCKGRFLKSNNMVDCFLFLHHCIPTLVIGNYQMLAESLLLHSNYQLRRVRANTCIL